MLDYILMGLIGFICCGIGYVIGSFLEKPNKPDNHTNTGHRDIDVKDLEDK